jgi:hypothetical protein
MEKSKKDKILIILVSWAILAIMITIFFINFKGLHDPFNDCYYEKAILLNQYLVNSDAVKLEYRCLWFNVNGEECERMPCGHIGVCKNNINRSFYFQEEHKLRDDLKQGDNIIIRWCYNEKVGKDFINGVVKDE